MTPTPLSAAQSIERKAVSLEEAAQMLGGVHVNTIKREIKRGNLRSFHIGRRHMVRVAEIDAYLAYQTKRGSK